MSPALGGGLSPAMSPPSCHPERSATKGLAGKSNIGAQCNPIVIQLKDQGTGRRPEIKINHGPVKWQSLESELQSIYRNRAERVAFVKGDPEIEFAFVAEALDITHRAGVDRIGLIGQK